MILFKEAHVAPILTGRKTQTRRLWAKPRVNVGNVYQARTRMLDATSTFAKLRVKRVWKEGSLDAISPTDAWAEGYDSVDEFLAVFRSINRWLPNQVGVTGRELFAVEFEVMKEVLG